MWSDHDARLRKQGTVCIAPGCQCRMRTDMMVRIFNEEMESVDSASAKFTDRLDRPCVMESSDSDSQDDVPGTYTPPIQRRRGRRYASLRKHETDVEDYLSCSSAEEEWIDRSSSWCQHC